MNKDEIDLLDKTLGKTNDWLKFAEAKNGALIAVDCTVMFGISRVASGLTDIPNLLMVYLASFYFFALISLIISLSSFIPSA